MSNKHSTGPLCSSFVSALPQVDIGGAQMPVEIREFAMPDIEKAHIQRLPCAAQIAGHSFGLLFDAAARIQVVFACNPYGVVVYLRPGHDIALGKTGNGSLTTELGLVEW